MGGQIISEYIVKVDESTVYEIMGSHAVKKVGDPSIGSVVKYSVNLNDGKMKLLDCGAYYTSTDPDLERLKLKIKKLHDRL